MWPNLIDFMLLWFYGDCESEYRSAGPVHPGDSLETGFKFWSAGSEGFLRTSAMGGADESHWYEFSSGPEGLVLGQNVVAVEVHQISGNSSDISFDLIVEARQSQVENSIILNQNTAVTSRVQENGLWSAVNEASFVVGPQ